MSFILIFLHFPVGYGTVFVSIHTLIAMTGLVFLSVLRYRQGFRFPVMLKAGIILRIPACLLW